MCYTKKLCTCNEVSESDDYWKLEFFYAQDPSFGKVIDTRDEHKELAIKFAAENAYAVGPMPMPRFKELYTGLADLTQMKKAINAEVDWLNSGNPFDFDYEPFQGDRLMFVIGGNKIAFSYIDGAWKHKPHQAYSQDSRRGIDADSEDKKSRLNARKHLQSQHINSNMPYEITGNWKKGIAFDNHTLSSSLVGVNEFGHNVYDNKYSEMGELVYQLKYKNNRDSIPKIIALLLQIKGIENMDLIIPIPPTDGSRSFQPVTLIAQALGQQCKVEVATDLLLKKPGGPQLKNVNDPKERLSLLKDSMSISESRNISGLNILLVDDLYRSGSTLSAATDLLLIQGQAASVSVITMTKTRSNT